VVDLKQTNGAEKRREERDSSSRGDTEWTSTRQFIPGVPRLIKLEGWQKEKKVDKLQGVGQRARAEGSVETRLKSGYRRVLNT